MALVTNYWSLDGIIVLTAFMVAVYLYMTRKFNYWKKRNVLEIPPMPFFGNFWKCISFQKAPGHVIKDMYDLAQGLPYMGFYIFDQPAFLIRDPELIKNILVKDFNDFNDRYSWADVKDRLGHSNLFFINNPAWKILRSKLTPIFTSGKLKKMFELMLECADNLDTYLKSLKLDGKAKIIDAKDVAAKFTTDIIGITAYGLNVNSLNNPDAEFRKYGKKIFETTYIRGLQLFMIFFYPRIVPLAGIKFFGTESTKFLRTVFWETISARMKSGQKRNDLIDILVDLKINHGDHDVGGFKFDGDDLVAQAAVFFTGGFETSSTTISFALYELALNPEIQDRLRKEILKVLDEADGKLTYDLVMSGIPYLDMVVAESLRMYPTLPALDRIVTNNYKVPNSDLVLEKGTPVYISVYGTHRDPEYFPNPHKFDPERFNEENKLSRPSIIYLPFGEGPRACIGTRLGYLQVKLGIIKIISQYEVIPCEKTLIPMVLDPKAPLTTAIGANIYLNIREINKTN